MTPALQYISHKLTERELSVALIVSDHEPYVIPVWPLPKKSQLILAKIIRKACSKYKLEPSWLTALASFSNKCLPKVFDAHRPDDYIVRRSIVQNEVVFSEEGLTLLSIDHIYTFKQLLLTLSKNDWVPHARDVCLSSCVHILNHINEVYTDPKVSKGYLASVYKEVDFKQEEYEEVCSAHSANYCLASIKDVTTVEPDYTALSDIALDWKCESPVPELQDTSDPGSRRSEDDVISPIGTVDLSTLESWEGEARQEGHDILSPLNNPPLSYPQIHRPSEVPESPLDPMAPWNSAIPTALNSRASRSSTLLPSPPISSSESGGSRDMVPPPLNLSDSWDYAIPAPLETIESRSSGSQQSPFEYVRSWVESWSTLAPLCENCHGVAAVPKRFTIA